MTPPRHRPSAATASRSHQRHHPEPRARERAERGVELGERTVVSGRRFDRGIRAAAHPCVRAGHHARRAGRRQGPGVPRHLRHGSGERTVVVGTAGLVLPERVRASRCFIRRRGRHRVRQHLSRIARRRHRGNARSDRRAARRADVGVDRAGAGGRDARASDVPGRRDRRDGSRRRRCHPALRACR